MIYLDNAATTFPKPESVYLEMDRINRSLAVNTGRGSYKAAKEASLILDETKNLLLKLFNAEGKADIVFTPSITHALNQVIGGLDFTADSVVYLSPYEHNAVARTIHEYSKKIGFTVELLALNQQLEIDVEQVEYQFSVKKPSYVFCCAVSNVTGYILPIKDVFDKAKQYSAVTIVDAAQAAGLIDIDIDGSKADIICFAGHKTLYGPFGIGGFALRKGIALDVFLTGGTGSDSTNLEMPEGTPARYEASSPNIVAIAGLNVALKSINREEHELRTRELTNYLIDKLADVYKVTILGNTENNIGIVSFVVDGYTADEVGTILDDEFDIAVRTGYHCAAYIHDYLNDKEYVGTVRVGVGYYSTVDEIDALVDALESL